MTEYINKVQRYKNKVNTRLIIRTLLFCLVLLMLVFHIYFAVWLNSNPYSDVISLFGIALKILLSLILLFLILNAYKALYSRLQTARLLDLQIDFKDDLYQNLLELQAQDVDKSILNQLAQSAEQRLSSHTYDLPPILKSWQSFGMLFFMLGVITIWSLNFSDFKRSSLQFYTNKAEQIVYKDFIEISPGNLRIGKNQQLLIKVINPEARLQHQLFYRYDKAWRELALTDNSYTFESLDNTIEYYVSNSVTKSPVFKIEVLDEPFVRRWWVEYIYPAYTRFRTEMDTLSYGNIQAYKYSTVKLSIETNIPVQKATMNRSDGTIIDLQRVDQQNYITQFQVLKPDIWYLELIDELGRRSQPEEKRITIIADNPPQISIVYPGEDIMLNQNLLLPLIISADDDFGLKNLSLSFKINDGPEQNIMLQSVIESKLYQKDYVLSLREINLFPGDVVSYWAEVYDNSPDNQKAVSKVFRARFPSIEEIYKALEQGEDQKKDELKAALDKSNQIQKEFEQKRRELLKESELNWEDKKQLQDMLQNQEKLAEQVENVAENYQELIEKMQSNQALSSETLEKMQKIQELMQEIANEDLLKAMSQFEKALNELSPDAIKKAMENFKFSMEDFSKKIEQTLDLLESIKKEQAVQKALQISEEMEKMQKALHDKTGDPSQDNKDLAKEQQSISEKYENLKEELDKLDKMLDPAKDQKAKQQLSELQKEMQKSDAEKDMQKSSKQLENNQKAASQQAQKDAMEKMRIFSQKLSEMKSSMSAGSQQGMMQAIQTAIRELLIFSKKHEETTARYNRDPYTIISDLISHYEGIQIVLNKLYASLQVMMFIPPKFFIDLSTTYQNYRELFVNVSEMQYHMIPQVLANIQSGLNLMIYDLMQALQNQSSGSGSGGGMQSLMQMLEQMGQEQMAMNMLTQSMLQQLQDQGGRSNPAMQQQIQKLANDTERMTENLKRALQNNPEAQKQGNAIKQIIEEAEALSRQLRSNQLNQDLLHRQERILSKLLDAQRSLNKRDQSQKRKGETAEQRFQDRKAGSIDYDQLRRNASLDDSYRSFPKEYQEVILRYLKNLNEQSPQ